MSEEFDYLKESEKTEKKFPEGLILDQRKAELLHHTMGIEGEAGELTDKMKRHIIFGKELDVVGVLEEIGDLLWFIAGILRILGKSFLDVQLANIAKLKLRKDKKDAIATIENRDLNTERAQLEAMFQQKKDTP